MQRLVQKDMQRFAPGPLSACNGLQDDWVNTGCWPDVTEDIGKARICHDDLYT